MLLDESCGVCVALKYKSERLCYAGDDETTIFFYVCSDCLFMIRLLKFVRAGDKPTSYYCQ